MKKYEVPELSVEWFEEVICTVTDSMLIDGTGSGEGYGEQIGDGSQFPF